MMEKVGFWVVEFARFMGASLGEYKLLDANSFGIWVFVFFAHICINECFESVDEELRALDDQLLDDVAVFSCEPLVGQDPESTDRAIIVCDEALAYAVIFYTLSMCASSVCLVVISFYLFELECNYGFSPNYCWCWRFFVFCMVLNCTHYISKRFTIQ